MATYRFYSILRQTILLVNGEPIESERVKSNSKANFKFNSDNSGFLIILTFLIS